MHKRSMNTETEKDDSVKFTPRSTSAFVTVASSNTTTTGQTTTPHINVQGETCSVLEKPTHNSNELKHS
jgi:hypothetical protein